MSSHFEGKFKPVWIFLYIKRQFERANFGKKKKKKKKKQTSAYHLCSSFWCRVLRRAGIAGILPAGVWLCRLQRKFGRFLPAGIFRWFYVFAGWRSFCLSKTDPKRRNALVSILVVAESSDGRSSIRLKVRLSTRARQVAVRVFRTERRSWSRKPRPCVSDHVQVTQNAPRHFRSTQCCMRSRDRDRARWRVIPWTQDGVDRRIFRNARAVFGLSIAKKDFEDVEKSGFVNFISFERYW